MRDNDHPLALATDDLLARHLPPLGALRDHPAVHDAARTAIADQVIARVRDAFGHQAMRLLVRDFHAFREDGGWEPDPASDAALRAYAEHLRGGDALDRLWAQAPLLAPRLRVLAGNARDAALEILTHFHEDRPLLTAAGLAASDDLVSALALAEGDTHRHGRAVAVVHLASGRRLVHKPRSLALDAHLPGVWGVLDADLLHSLRGCVPASIDRGDHGWQDFVDTSQELDAASCERYFYRFGALTALAGLWGATDLHHENVVTRGDHPVVIDAETLLQPQSRATSLLDDETVAAYDATPLGTLLLPVRDEASVMDVLLSGLGIPWHQTSEQTVYQLTDENSDAIAVARLPWTLMQDSNVPSVGGVPQNPLSWYAAVKRGYLDALRAVRENLHALSAALRALPPEATVRVVFRATEVYSRYLDALTDPDQFADPGAQAAVLALLEPPADAGPAAAWLVASERRQLRDGDVPIFALGVADTQVLGDELSPVAPFSAGPVEAAIARMRAGTALSEEFHLLILETCCTELGRGPRPQALTADALFRPLLDEPSAASAADALVRAGLRTTPGGGAEELSWGGGTGLGGNTFDTGTSVSFHDFGGPVAFLRRYARLTGRRQSDAQAAARGWHRRAALMEPVLAEIPWSVIAGHVSVPLVLGSGTSLPGSAGSGAAGHPNAAAIDVAHGSAGLVAMLAADPGATDAEALRAHAERVSAALTPGGGMDTDLLHGRLGLAWALLRAGRRLGRGDWVARARRAVEASVGAVEEGTPRGWCNGLAGLALVAAEAGLPGAVVDELIRAATAHAPGGSVDLSVCHGEAGIAQVVSWIDRRSGASPARARRHLERSFALARSHGFHNGSHGHTALLGYVLGWSGVADTLLLVGDESGLLSHPVALEVDPVLAAEVDPVLAAEPAPIESGCLVGTSGSAA